MYPHPWKKYLTFPRLDEWKGFSLGAVIIMLAAAALDFMNGAKTTAAVSQALMSLEFASLLVGAALLAGVAVWLLVWLYQRTRVAPDAKETVLWCACLVTTFVSGARLFS